MSGIVDETWLEARVARTQTLIVAYENAIEALACGAQSYMLDTGQTRQSVTKADLANLREMLAFLENRLDQEEARLQGGGFILGRTGY